MPSPPQSCDLPCVGTAQPLGNGETWRMTASSFAIDTRIDQVLLPPPARSVDVA
ncbi:hypothetical protein [Dactylosporangium sp. CA-092794]|uniref:hypothetical protein n=1 Tax=Dactylosporangium sp. CA-092794 TaxID=3239929 RepID=UPI003D922E98